MSLSSLFTILVYALWATWAIWSVYETHCASKRQRLIDELRSKNKALQEEKAQLEADSRRYVDDEAMR